jgi:hypothetical protein
MLNRVAGAFKILDEPCFLSDEQYLCSAATIAKGRVGMRRSGAFLTRRRLNYAFQVTDTWPVIPDLTRHSIPVDNLQN